MSQSPGQLSQLMKQPVYLVAAAVAALLVGFAIAVAPTSLTVIGLAGAIMAIIAWRSPMAGFLFLTFVLPFERIGSYDISGGTIRASQILALLLLMIWPARVLILRQRSFAPNPLIWPILAFLVINLFSLTNAPNSERSIVLYIVTCFTLLFSLLIPQLITDEHKMRRVIGVLLLSTAVVCLFGLWQFAGDMLGLPTSVTGLREHYTKAVFGFPRIQSTALEPLYFANFLILPLCLLYAFLLRRITTIRRPLVVGLLLLAGLNLVLTVSRGGYLGFGFAALVITVLFAKHFFHWKFLLPAFGLVVLISLLVPRLLGFGDVFQLNTETFSSHIRNVFTGASYAERIDTFEIAQRAWWEHPWVGIGPGSFGPYAAAHPYAEPTDGWKIVNNEFIELLAETGLLGLLAFLSLLIILVVRSIKAILRAATVEHRALMIAMLAALLGVIVQYQTFSVLYIMHIWFLIGLTVAMQNIILSRRPS